MRYEARPSKNQFRVKLCTKVACPIKNGVKAGLWRDIHPAEMKYSNQAQIYFNTIPKLRSCLIEEIREHNKIISDRPITE